MNEYDFTDKTSQDIITAYQSERDNGNYADVMKQYKDPATKYAFYVLEQKVKTAESIKLWAFRHLQDLRRSLDDSSDFDYYYNLQRARNIVQFAALCPNPDSGQPTPLALWQLAILCEIEGWRHKQDNTPRFSDVIVSVGRTNGKTYLATILIMYHFLIDIDGLNNQDLAYVATTTSQTDKGWRYIMSTAHMIETTPGFKQLCKSRGLHVVSDKLSDNAENRLLKMSQQSGVFDSFHFTFVVTDEAGSNEMPVMKIADNKSKITTGMTQSAGQIVQISTAYPDSGSYLYKDEQIDIRAMRKDNNRALDDHLLMLWTQDYVKEVHDPESWVKSNPLIDLNENKKITMTRNLIGKRDSASQDGKLADFENKNLNMWLQTKVNSYLKLEDINDAVTNKPPINIDGAVCYVGIDLSHFSDDSSLAFVFPFVDKEGHKKFYIKQHSFVPTARSQGSIEIKSAQDGINYRNAEKLGNATIAKNIYGYIDDDTIYNYLVDFVTRHNLQVKYFLYDAWEASPLVDRLCQYGDSMNWQVMPVRQGTLSLTQPTEYFRKLMNTKRIVFDNDEILKYSLKNAILLNDNHGIKVDKDKATSKIDVVDAVIDAFFRAQYYFSDVNPDSENDNNNPFVNMSAKEQEDYFANYTF